jgi:DNA-binding protein YbaB
VAEKVDRDANQALRKRLAEIHGRYARLRSDLDSLQRRLDTMRVSAVSADGLVRATVGARGQLLALGLDRRACRELDTDRLAQVIVATVSDAASRTAGEVEGLVGEYLPDDSATLSYLRSDDLGSLLGSVGEQPR